MEVFESMDNKNNLRLIKNECIMTYKVHDSCKNQVCLTHKQLGPASVIECCSSNESMEKIIVRPPQRAAAVIIDELKIKNIYVMKKRPHLSREGYWDVSLSFVFEYILTFLDVSGCALSNIKAGNVFIYKTTLYGSINNNMVGITDLCGNIMPIVPCVWAESKAIALDAEIYRSPTHNCHDEVRVKIGLYTVVKLIRRASLVIQSRGFCSSEECDIITDPCEIFKTTDFTSDIY